MLRIMYPTKCYYEKRNLLLLTKKLDKEAEKLTEKLLPTNINSTRIMSESTRKENVIPFNRSLLLFTYTWA